MRKPIITVIRYSFRMLVLLLFVACIACNNTETTLLTTDKSRGLHQDNFRFVVAADPQLFRGKKEDLENAFLSINDLEPDFVVMCGDSIETPSNMEQIKAYKDSLSNLSPAISLYNVPGNHDLGQPIKSKNVSVYQEHFGDLWFHFQHGNSLFIVLSSDILRDPNAPMHNQQTDWLITTLKDSQLKTVDNIFVFMHHPLYLDSPDEPDAYFNMPLEIRKDLLNFFVKYQVKAVFSGHYHNNKINRYQRIDLITTNSITVSMGKVLAGFRAVEVHQNGYNQQYHTLEKLEKKELAK